MALHYPVNNYRATLAAPMTPGDRQIVLDQGCGGPLTQMPCFVSIEDEIIEVQDRQRAYAQTGTEGTDRITWAAAQDGDTGNGIAITLVDPAASIAPLSVTREEGEVIISLGTDENGALVSAVNDVLLALASHVEASGLLMAFSGDTGVVAAAERAVLSGGDSDVLNIPEDYGCRGAQGTNPASHPVGASVEVRYTAGHLIELQNMAGLQILNPIQFAVASGTPSLEDMEVGAASGIMTRAWKFGPDATGAISTLFLVPPALPGRRLNVILFLYSKSSDTGNCQWTIRGRAMNWMLGPTVADQPEVSLSGNCGAPGAEQLTMSITPLEFPGMGIGGGPMTLVIERNGDAAEDTFTSDAWLVGVAVLGNM